MARPIVRCARGTHGGHGGARDETIMVAPPAGALTQINRAPRAPG
ncbi:hypothetical protein BURPS406E_G0300 [Burkholderia pseudomallei 406e]|uniref:Uncharacterized protein n=1 Tax=Burkholderia pseudomallei 1710a TaxID=320371 RepID=A0A0E1VUZ3_BURPE|nr:hypothetical protein BURPS668_A1225 [Burkholderia pseudomallei 668]ABO02007.1 hypothetical protein BMA10247_A1728 [Burkholderia mallei NCTC 10247]AFR19096.1 hypothetical protein BPC006_II1168 [Burkholderia pseudomallei BPC006]EDK52104.1 hypothetical protein BMAFMH_I0165 [Burkholderia mallei FMH]EDK57414.1 hypothetical protein BMAJHU_F0163 [Burkholderia mallei JHU]EDK82760.1 hypothetical protein BMA721280_K0169 [Burkholderia mallei 2002721280]EDO87461.1 hypothetical protein BURPS406E_G0300 